MADLKTFNEDDDQTNDLVDCTVCNRRIKAGIQWKVHLTSPQHLKTDSAFCITKLLENLLFLSYVLAQKDVNKEVTLAAKGFIPRPNPLPKWTDIKQYLKYLNLDEPIIGLNELVQEDDMVLDDGQVHLRYSCKMCGVAMDMWTMVFHVVSRKHRSKYLQMKRPDLLHLKNTECIQKQPGLARSMAAILAKQEGWGTPVVLNRPSRARSPTMKNQGQGMTESLDAYAHKSSYSGRNRRGQSPLAEDSYRGSYREDDAPRRPSRYHEDDLYDRDDYDLQSYAEDDGYKMTYYQETSKGPYQDDERYERPYPEGNTSIRSFREDDDSRRRHNDVDLRGESYRSKHQDEGYAERNPRRGWNSSGDAQEDTYHGSARGNRFADRAIRHRDDSEDYALSPAPAKKKRKSRFSDATPLEMEMTQNRFMVDTIHTNNPKGAVLMGSQVYENRFDSDVPHASLNQGNVLDILDDIKIENMDEANFMKEKLCSLVKEFHANKVQRTGVTRCIRDYHHGNDKWLDQSKNLQESVHLDDQGFGEATRYEHDPRDFQERTYFEDQHILHKDFEDNPAVFQKAKRFEDNPRAFQNERQFGDDPSSFEQTRVFVNTPRDFQHEGRFEDDPTNFQRARSFEGNSRTDHTKELSRSFQNVRHVRSTEEHRGYEKYDRREEGGYCESDFRHSQNSLDTRHDYEWDHRGGISAERSQDIKGYHRDDDRRDFQENLWKSTSLREDEKVYGESQARRPHYRHDYSSGAEPYDPFQPSSSPPQEGAPPSSLEKLASTLLELVARKSN